MSNIIKEIEDRFMAQREFFSLLELFKVGLGTPRMACRIRTLARLFVWLGDSMPDEVYEKVYCVGAKGTSNPWKDR